MDFGVLGPLTVWRAGVPLELGTPKGRLLLAVLLSRPGRPSGLFYVAHAWGCLHLARGEYTEARRRLLEGVEVARTP